MPLIAWKALDWLKSIPWQAWAIALLIILYPVAYCVGRENGEDARDAHWRTELAKGNEKALINAGVAADDAREVAADVVEDIEAGNDAARAAAKDSDDPLKAALEALR